MISIWLTIVIAIFTIYILRLISKQKVELKSVTVWLILAIVSIIFIWVPSIISILSKILDVQIPSNLVFILSIFLLLYLTFSLTLQVSKLTVQIRELSQKVALHDSEKINE